MRVVPEDKVGKIEFAEARVSAWTAGSTEIGSSPAEVAAWAEQVAAARAAFREQREARNAAKSATLKFDLALEAMAVATGNIVRQVRAKAATAGDGVYSLALIPTPAAPSPMGPPGVPYGFEAVLRANGSVELTWKCRNRGCRGVIYQVWRRAGWAGEFAYLGGSGRRRFVDAAVPAGVPTVLYRIQATRSTAAGDAAEFVVNFGVSASSGPTTTMAVAA